MESTSDRIPGFGLEQHVGLDDEFLDAPTGLAFAHGPWTLLLGNPSGVGQSLLPVAQIFSKAPIESLAPWFEYSANVAKLPCHSEKRGSDTIL